MRYNLIRSWANWDSQKRQVEAIFLDPRLAQKVANFLNDDQGGMKWAHFSMEPAEETD